MPSAIGLVYTQIPSIKLNLSFAQLYVVYTLSSFISLSIKNFTTLQEVDTDGRRGAGSKLSWPGRGPLGRGSLGKAIGPARSLGLLQAEISPAKLSSRRDQRETYRNSFSGYGSAGLLF